MLSFLMFGVGSCRETTCSVMQHQKLLLAWNFEVFYQHFYSGSIQKVCNIQLRLNCKHSGCYHQHSLVELTKWVKERCKRQERLFVINRLVTKLQGKRARMQSIGQLCSRIERRETRRGKDDCLHLIV